MFNTSAFSVILLCDNVGSFPTGYFKGLKSKRRVSSQFSGPVCLGGLGPVVVGLGGGNMKGCGFATCHMSRQINNPPHSMLLVAFTSPVIVIHMTQELCLF